MVSSYKVNILPLDLTILPLHLVSVGFCKIDHIILQRHNFCAFSIFAGSMPSIRSSAIGSG
jgi:hypothetical protein